MKINEYSKGMRFLTSDEGDYSPNAPDIFVQEKPDYRMPSLEQGFADGGSVGGNFVKPKKKPEKEVKKRKKENFEKAKDALENPDEVREMFNTGGRPSLAESEKFYEDIKKSYNKLKKNLGRNPTQGELLRATGRKSQTAIRTATEKFGLELFNKPGETKVPKEVSQEARKKTTEKIRANKVITEPTLRDGKLIFPDKKMEKEFKNEVRKKYKYPVDSAAAEKAGVLTQKDFYKKFYKTRSPSTTIGDIGITAKELNLKYPKQTYEGDLKQKKIIEKRRTDLISDVSGKTEERKIVKAKREAGLGRAGENLDLAHRASLKQLKDLGVPYLADNLGLDTRKVNQEILPPLEKEANSLHKQRMKLIKGVEPGNVPKEVSKKLEDINIKLSNISLKTNGALQAVLIDEKNLKPFVFNKNYANVIGQGLIDKPVKDLSNADLDFIKATFPQAAKIAKNESGFKRSGGVTLGSNFANVNKDLLDFRKLPGDVKNFADIAANLSKSPAGMKVLRNLTKAGKVTGYGLAAEAAFSAPFALSDYAGGKTGDRILGNATFGILGQTEQEEIKEAVGERGYATQTINELKDLIPRIKEQYKLFNDKNDPTFAQRDKFKKIHDINVKKYNEAYDNFVDDKGQFNNELYNQALNNYTAGMNQISKFDTMRAEERPDERTGLESYDVGLAGGGLLKQAGDRSGPALQSGPTPQGLDYLLKRGRQY